MLPRTKFIDTNSPFEQFEKIKSEVKEAEDAFLEGNLQHCAVETWDIIQAAFTQLEILSSKFGVDKVGAKETMLLKNFEKGYYKEG